MTVAEVSVSDKCEHGSFSIQVSSPAVWQFPGAGRIEAEPEALFVFSESDHSCECWEYEPHE